MAPLRVLPASVLALSTLLDPACGRPAGIPSSMKPRKDFSREMDDAPLWKEHRPVFPGVVDDIAVAEGLDATLLSTATTAIARPAASKSATKYRKSVDPDTHPGVFITVTDGATDTAKTDGMAVSHESLAVENRANAILNRPDTNALAPKAIDDEARPVINHARDLHHSTAKAKRSIWDHEYNWKNTGGFERLSKDFRSIINDFKKWQPVAHYWEGVGRSVGDTRLTLINATPYRWARTYQSDWQILWSPPEFIEPGASAAIKMVDKMALVHTDTAGEVRYVLEGTSKPMSFQVQSRHVNGHRMYIQYEGELETLNNPKKTRHDLGWDLGPGGVSFVIAGTEGDFVSVDPPLDWMHSQLHEIGDKPLREIIMPRSHHAGMYKFTRGLGIGIPTNTKTHDVGLKDQLGNGGIRVLDLRPHKIGNEFWEGHGSVVLGVYSGGLGASLNEMIDTVNKFNEDYPGELIIWDVHPTDGRNGNRGFQKLNTQDKKRLYEVFMKLNHRIRVPDNEDLTKLPLKRFIGNGTSAVLIRCNDAWIGEGNFPGGEEGFVSYRNFPSGGLWSNTDNMMNMMPKELLALQENRPSPSTTMWNAEWTLTQKGLRPVFPDPSIVEMNIKTWNALYHEFWDNINSSTYPTWLTVDNVHGNRLKALAMTINKCLVAKRCGALGGKVKGLI